MPLSWIVLEVFLNAYEAAYFTSIIAVRSQLKSWVRVKHIVFSGIALTAAFCVVNFTTNFSYYSAYIWPLLILTFTLIVTQGKMLSRLLWSIVPFAVLAACELLVLFLVTYFAPLPLEKFYQPGIYRLFWIFMAKTLDTIAWYFLITLELHKTKRNWENNPNKILINLSIISFIAFLLLLLHSIIKKDPEGYMQLAAVLLSLLVLCYGIAYKIISDLEKKQLALRKTYNSEIIKAYQNLRELRQDIFRQLQQIWQLGGYKKNAPKSREYLDYLNKINRQLKIHFRTGDDMIDILLAAKEAECFRHGIVLRINTKTPLKHNLPSAEVSVILNNMLDNAAAYLANHEADKIIVLSLLTDRKSFSIHLEHPLDDTAVSEHASLPDKGREFADIRQAMVKELVDKHQGTLISDRQSNLLSIRIKLPLKIHLTLVDNSRQA